MDLNFRLKNNKTQQNQLQNLLQFSLIVMDLLVCKINQQIITKVNTKIEIVIQNIIKVLIAIPKGKYKDCK